MKKMLTILVAAAAATHRDLTTRDRATTALR